MPFLVIGGLLGQNSPGGKVGTICFNAEWFGVIRENKDQSGGDLFFEDIKGGLFFGGPHFHFGSALVKSNRGWA